MTQDQNICKWEKKGSIGLLSINNPPENYLSDPVFISDDIVNEIKHDQFLKGIIIIGTGRHFSAGAEMERLKALARNETTLYEKITGGKRIISFFESLNIPVIAAIKGICFGAGLEIALSCHIRICSENALFAFPETNHGIMPGMGGTVLLPKISGAGKAAELILKGEMINAGEALRIRLADYVVSAKELMSFSVSYLKELISDREIEVINSVIKSIHNSGTLSFEDALKEETKLFCSLAVKSLKKNG